MYIHNFINYKYNNLPYTCNTNYTKYSITYITYITGSCFSRFFDQNPQWHTEKVVIVILLHLTHFVLLYFVRMMTTVVWQWDSSCPAWELPRDFGKCVWNTTHFLGKYLPVRADEWSSSESSFPGLEKYSINTNTHIPVWHRSVQFLVT